MGGRRWWVLSALIVGLLPFVVDVALVLPALPHLPGSRPEQALLAATLPLALALVLPLAAGSSRVRRLLLLGLALALAGSVVEAASHAPPALLIGRLVVALGAAAALPAGLRTVQAAFDPAEHVRAVAIWAGFTGLALAVAPLVGGVLVAGHGAPAVFAVQVPFFAIGLLTLAALLPRLVPDPSSAKGVSRELVGPAAVFALVATAAALSVRLQPGWSAGHVGLLLGVPVLAFSLAARLGATRIGLLAVALSAAGIAVTGSLGLVLLIPLGAGAALAVSAAPGSPLARLLAVGLGLAASALTPREAVLTASVASAAVLGADLLRRRSGGRCQLAPS